MAQINYCYKQLKTLWMQVQSQSSGLHKGQVLELQVEV